MQRMGSYFESISGQGAGIRGEGSREEKEARAEEEEKNQSNGRNLEELSVRFSLLTLVQE